MSEVNSLSKLLEQIEIPAKERKILEGCGEAGVAAKLHDFDPLINVRPYLFQEQLRAITTHREHDEMKEEIDRIKQLVELEKEQINFLQKIIEVEKSEQVSDKEINKISMDLDSKLKQYTKELNASDAQKLGTEDSLKNIIAMYEKLQIKK